MKILWRRVSARHVLAALLAALVLTAVGAVGLHTYQRHQRQLALERLLQETCDSCARRHTALQRLRETLQQGDQEETVPETE